MTRSGTDPIRVALADDHPVVRDGLSALLGSVAGIDVVATAATGRDAVRAAVTLCPDVLVLDIQMPDLDGVSAAREITRDAPAVAVLMLTMFDDDESVLAAMRAGAKGYVLKGATQEEIVSGDPRSCGRRGHIRTGRRPAGARSAVRQSSRDRPLPAAHSARAAGPRATCGRAVDHGDRREARPSQQDDQ